MSAEPTTLAELEEMFAKWSDTAHQQSELARNDQAPNGLSGRLKMEGNIWAIAANAVRALAERTGTP